MKEKIIRKWFFVWDFEKEERWLDDMAKQGWVLDGVGFGKYRFVPCEPGAYAVRLEMLNWLPRSEEGRKYIGFVEETGAEFVASYMRWVYFRKKVADGPFDLFSDIDSRVRHLDAIIKLVGGVGLANLAIGVGSLKTLGWINFACAALMAYCAWRLNRKKERLQEERKLHE